MEKKKAQLILVGGRSSVPNILTILHQKPEVVLALCSHESHDDFPSFKHMVETVLPTCRVEELHPVDAFEPEEIARQCTEAFQRYPGADWICNITAATAIMSIAVYEQAKRLQKNCWYLNTSQARTITLVGPKLSDEENAAIFDLSVPEYVSAYYYSLKDGDLEERREQCEQQWLPFAQLLGKQPTLASRLKLAMDAISNDRPGKKGPKSYTLPKLPRETHDIVKEAERFGLVSNVKNDLDSLKFTLTYLQASFLNGGWLELYVWNEARQITLPDKSNLFDDSQWNHKVTVSGVTRELDVALTYRAQLIIAECKTGDETRDSETLNKLVSVANPLGGRFVGKILISSLFSPDETDPDETQRNGRLREQIKAHRDFLAKAHHHHIVVIMAEDLPRIRDLLEEEAITPKYPRI
ncbi:MAG TPA: DUF1887 family CARF protein [Ktedonobacteraceae bacterium]|jgi:hypothetical protein